MIMWLLFYFIAFSKYDIKIKSKYDLQRIYCIVWYYLQFNSNFLKSMCLFFILTFEQEQQPYLIDYIEYN